MMKIFNEKKIERNFVTPFLRRIYIEEIGGCYSKSQGKCCKMVIDSGSTDHLVSTEMVEKLGLKRMKHPNPYKVSWLQKGHQILVNE